MLLFKKKFLPAILAGTKTQTIRLWSACRYRAGQRSYIPGAGYIRINTIEIVELTALTEADATLDGFLSLAELLAEIASLYSTPTTKPVVAYRVRFELLSPTEQLAARAEKQARKQVNC